MLYISSIKFKWIKINIPILIKLLFNNFKKI